MKVNGVKSEARELETGLPQGSVLSCTLFNLAIEALLRAVDDPVRALLFADDLVLFLSGKDDKQTEATLQATVNKLNEAAKENDFKFSKKKTEVVLFSRKRKNNVDPCLFLGGSRIKVSDNFKFLGMIMDSKLNWNDYIEYIGSKAKKNLNVLRVLSNTNWGCSQATLLRIHKALVISILDYGSFLYQSASKKSLAKLDSINNQGMRLALGAFRSTPIESLHAESGIMKLEIRREMLGTSYITKVMANTDHPAFEDYDMLCTSRNLMTSNGNEKKISFLVRSMKNFSKIENADKVRFVDDSFFCKVPPWMICNASIDTSLTRFKKDETETETFVLEFEKRLKANIRVANAENDHTVIFTDGSVKENKTGLGVHSKNIEFKMRLPDLTSIFTAEMTAIWKAVNVGKDENKKLTIICSDSFASILTLRKIYSRDQIALKIKEEMYDASHQKFVFLWIPSHKGIEGNERADFLANEAVTLPDEQISERAATLKDLKTRIRKHYRDTTAKDWEMVDPNKNKLRKIKKRTGQTKNMNLLKRKDSVVITRLRLGHTRLTHGHLMTREEERVCTCGDILTVEHIFESCPRLRKARSKFKIRSIYTLSIDSKENYKNIIEFLRKTKIYYEI